MFRMYFVKSGIIKLPRIHERRLLKEKIYTQLPGTAKYKERKTVPLPGMKDE